QLPTDWQNRPSALEQVRLPPREHLGHLVVLKRPTRSPSQIPLLQRGLLPSSRSRLRRWSATLRARAARTREARAQPATEFLLSRQALQARAEPLAQRVKPRREVPRRPPCKPAPSAFPPQD